MNLREILKQDVMLLTITPRLFLLKKFDNTIGFCWAYPSSLKKAFGYGSNDPAMKIETFGLIKEETGKGHGQYFAPRLLSELFNSNAQMVFLESRSTNHKKVIPFYEGIGMNIIQKYENLPDDLIVA